MGESDDAIEGIRLKLKRACEHLKALDGEMAELTDRTPFQTGPPDINADSTKYAFHLRMREPIPLMWGVILGEAVHDLRSALDHVIYQLTLDWHGAELPRTSFPVMIDPDRWHKPVKVTFKNPSGLEYGSGLWLIRGVGPGPTAFIEALQPYPTRQPEDSDVLALHELWNQDKHRLLHFWGLQFVGDPYNVRIPGLQGTYNIAVERGVLKDGAKTYTVTFDQPNPGVDVYFGLASAVTFQNPADAGPARPAKPLLRLWEATGEIVEPLIASLGHQNDTPQLSRRSRTIRPRLCRAPCWPQATITSPMSRSVARR